MTKRGLQLTWSNAGDGYEVRSCLIDGWWWWMDGWDVAGGLLRFGVMTSSSGEVKSVLNIQLSSSVITIPLPLPLPRSCPLYVEPKQLVFTSRRMPTREKRIEGRMYDASTSVL
jgi:hypothetical protein